MDILIKEIRFMVYPLIYRKIKAIIREKGMVRITIRLARILLKNRIVTKTTRIPEIRSVRARL